MFNINQYDLPILKAYASSLRSVRNFSLRGWTPSSLRIIFLVHKQDLQIFPGLQSLLLGGVSMGHLDRAQRDYVDKDEYTRLQAQGMRGCDILATDVGGAARGRLDEVVLTNCRGLCRWTRCACWIWAVLTESYETVACILLKLFCSMREVFTDNVLMTIAWRRIVNVLIPNVGNLASTYIWEPKTMTSKVGMHTVRLVDHHPYR